MILFYINRTNREYTKQYSAQSRTIFHLFLQVTQNIYRSIVFLCAETPDDKSRKQSYILSGIPLLRVLMDIVFNIAFISEDVENRIGWYYKSGWREMKEMYNRCCVRSDIGTKQNNWLSNFKSYISETKSGYLISDKEEAELKTIKRWPIPCHMKKYTKQPLSNYFQYLDDWFYKEFSQASHLSLPGLSNIGGIFIKDRVEDEAEYFKKKRTDVYICTVMMVLSVLSEFEYIVKYGEKEKLKFIWTFIGEYSDDCKELYYKRYLTLLAS